MPRPDIDVDDVDDDDDWDTYDDDDDDGCCAIGRGPKVKIGRINKILWIQLGLYIRKPGEKSLTQKKVDFDEGDCT